MTVDESLYLIRVAEALTGWSFSDLAGLPLAEFFNISDQQALQPTENSTVVALAQGCRSAVEYDAILTAKSSVRIPIRDNLTKRRTDIHRQPRVCRYHF